MVIEEPLRITNLPHHAGQPVPWHVEWVDELGMPTRPSMGVPNGKTDRTKFDRCLARGRCWICGELRGRKGTFILNATNVIERTIAEPASHEECAEYAVQAYRANETVLCLWKTSSFLPYHERPNDIRFRLISNPDEVSWWMEGRRATREEAMTSYAAHLALLEQKAKARGYKECRTLRFQALRAIKFLPAEEEAHDLPGVQAGA